MRLESIKAALPTFARNRSQFKSVSESTVAYSEISSESGFQIASQPPLTLTSGASEQAKKKRKYTNVSV